MDGGNGPANEREASRRPMRMGEQGKRSGWQARKRQRSSLFQNPRKPRPRTFQNRAVTGGLRGGTKAGTLLP